MTWQTSRSPAWCGMSCAATNFGVLRLAAGQSTWTLAAPGMPNVEVSGLTIELAQRKLFAITSGLSA